MEKYRYLQFDNISRNQLYKIYDIFNNNKLWFIIIQNHIITVLYSKWNGETVIVVCHRNKKNNQSNHSNRNVSYFVWEIERYCNPNAIVAKEYSLKELRSLKEPDKLFPSQASITEGSTPIAPNASPLSYSETMRIILGLFGFAVLIFEHLLEFC